MDPNGKPIDFVEPPPTQSCGPRIRLLKISYVVLSPHGALVIGGVNKEIVVKTIPKIRPNTRADIARDFTDLA